MGQDNLLKNIQDGLQNGEFVAYYQPQYDAITKKLSSAEALVRWVREDGSIVSPMEFLPFAEEQGIITEIDWCVLKRVCEFQKRQQEEGFKVKTISCNFSRLHLGDLEVEKRIADFVDSYGISRKNIGIEITESAIQTHDQRMVQFVRNMRDMGFDVAIDDFGSGMSSMKLLHDIDASVLKIDKSLLSHNCQDEKERCLLESTIEMAQKLQMRTVAEGVETEEQLGFMRTCGCTKIQGFLLARPMPEKEYRDLLCNKLDVEEDDILLAQSMASAMELLNQAIFTRFPLIIMANLSRDSYYMMNYENFNQHTCTGSGMFHELISLGSTTMHPDDQELFRNTYCRENLLKEYEKGKKVVRLVTRQIGEDGIYRRVETADYFVKSPSSDDVLVITLCQNIE